MSSTGTRGRAATLCAAAVALALAASAPARAAVIDPAPYDALLAKYVTKGRVDYGGLKGEAAALDAWLAEAAKADLAKASRAERMAFWINVYNAATLQLVLRHHGSIDSIRDIDDPWKKPKWTVAGASVSLDQMEHEKLRRAFGDPRVHFVLVCAARSCPPLRAAAYTAEGLDRQLAQATRAFLASKDGAVTARDDGEPVLRLSKLFEWYADDFRAGKKEVVDWVAAHAPPETAAFIVANRARLTVAYLPYDWRLNAR